VSGANAHPGVERVLECLDACGHRWLHRVLRPEHDRPRIDPRRRAGRAALHVGHAHLPALAAAMDHNCPPDPPHIGAK
jgi:hypothetical protein